MKGCCIEGREHLNVQGISVNFSLKVMAFWRFSNEAENAMQGACGSLKLPRKNAVLTLCPGVASSGLTLVNALMLRR